MKYVEIPIEDFRAAIEPLSDVEIGRLFSAILKAHATGMPVALVGNEKYLGEWVSNHCRFRTEHNGENHWNWKGGKTSENQRERNSAAYAAWRKAVFVRDEFTCQLCGQVGGNLNAHHIKPFAEFPDLRFDESNGITLCKRCHYEVHHGA